MALERNWQRISERFRSSDTVNDGKIHLDDFTKQVLELRVEGLRDRDAVEQVGQDLGPDAHGQLNFDEFQWKMSSELLVEILAPNAPLLLNAFRSRLVKLRFVCDLSPCAISPCTCKQETKTESQGACVVMLAQD